MEYRTLPHGGEKISVIGLGRCTSVQFIKEANMAGRAAFLIC